MGAQKGCAIFWCFLYFLTGMGLFGTGLWMTTDDYVYDTVVMKDHREMKKSVQWNGMFGGQLALGCFAFIVGIVGMAGSGCNVESKIKGTLIAFAVLGSFGNMGTWVFSSFATVAFIGADKGDFDNGMRLGLYEHYNSTGKNKLQEAWDRYQVKQECCGVISYDDYDRNKLAEAHHRVPWSCCKLKDGVDKKEAIGIDDVANFTICNSEAYPYVDKTQLHDIGCGAIAWRRYRRDQKVFLGMGWACVFVQIVAMAVAGCLKKKAANTVDIY